MKLKLFVLFFIFFFSSAVFAQNTEKTPEKTQEKTMDNKTSIQEKDAIQEYNKTQGQTDTPLPQTPDTSSSFWGPFFFLLFLALILYVVLKYIRRKKNPPLAELDFFQSLGSLSLSNGALLEIIEIGDAVYLLGIGSGSVNLLTQIEDKDLILKLKSRPLAPKHKNFLDILGSVFESRGKKINPQKQKGFKDLIKEKKDRLKKLL